MEGKIIRNSVIGIVLGIALSIASEYIPGVNEPVNYAGGMFIFGGGIFIDQAILMKIYGENRPGKASLVRLPVYLLLSVLLLLIPQKITVSVIVVRLFKAFGIAFLLLALWRFFTFTTVEEQKISDKKEN